MKHLHIFTVIILSQIQYIAQNAPQNSAPNFSAPSEIIEKKASSIETISQATLKNYTYTRSTLVNKNDKSISPANQLKLDIILENIQATNPNSYEYYYASYLNQNRSINAFPLLQKAAEIYPKNETLNKDFIHHYELINDISKRNYYCKKLFETNTIDDVLMEYNMNVLISVPKNGVLMTYGSDDTYPIFVLQNIKNFRKDVLVLNLEMLSEEFYRKTKSEAYKINIEWKENIINTAEWILKNNASKIISLGHTVSPKLLQNIKSQLYITGLTYQYSEKPIDNIEIVLENLEKIKIDQLKKAPNYGAYAKLNGNYILPLLTILEYHSAQKNEIKSKEIKELILKVARQQGVDFETKIKDYLLSLGL